ncbi:hypothetical protein CRI77_15645 [Mycolicibacterium duvalii]|uniref:Uncharacterized protein n=1 Tax=Mycolicibacterium duvalii TaxID=39688 RepID=A0A7I7JTZ2_9MYCO|nr:DUF488 domain-containing protein [Mycolicibacterium duvalii]MCV7368629.1 DUF488 domain-containing protein [Mycolicibacterium duvalii]PEG39626.1 hypothetical protein CRI77_15645 [Mycolicibacterium duvalii]BBX15327.1 hypothetical protein MDUV_01870 [Mycolicibacterium duvalii]
MTELVTVGHGALRSAALAALFDGAGVRAVVDIRRFPASRHNPDVARASLESWAPEAGVAYRWDDRLGGRRRLPAGTETVDTWWRVAQFAAYAAYTRTEDFGCALEDLLEQAGRQRTAIMCSEAVWWRCHRRLVADVAVLARGIDVAHLMHDGRLLAHAPADGARLGADGRVYWTG